MERPSHLHIDMHASLGRRATLLSIALSVQVGGALLFIYGLATGHVKLPSGPIEFLPIEQTEPPRTPPPTDPVFKQPTIPQVPIPQFKTGPADTGQNKGITASTADMPTAPSGPVNPVVIKPPVTVAGTHTVPPYPPAMRRIGAEGTVTLRLTVNAEGRVSAADIVTSAGQALLDEAAQAWILSHWRYRPATRDGVPAPSQTMASVTFSLKD